MPENWVKSRELQVPETEGIDFVIVVPENWVKSRESQVPDTEGNCFFIVVPENWVKSSGGQIDEFRPLTSTLGGRAWCAGTNM